MRSGARRPFAKIDDASEKFLRPRVGFQEGRERLGGVLRTPGGLRTRGAAHFFENLVIYV